MRKSGIVAVMVGVWMLGGLTFSLGQMVTETRLEGVSIQGAPARARTAEDRPEQVLAPGETRDPAEERRRERDAQLEVERRQRQAEANRVNTIRRGVLAITHDETLADVLAQSSLTLADLEELLSRYDWSANLEAEKIRALRMRETMLQAADTGYWSGETVPAAEFSLKDVSQQGDTIRGYVENKSARAHQRFRMEGVIRAADGQELTLESDYVEQFEVGERRLIRFKTPWSDKTVTNVKITGCRAFSRPSR